MQGFFKNKDIRTFAASSIYVVLVLALLGYLTVVDIPTDNKDIIISIISIIVGGLSVAMGNLFGAPDDEKDKLQRRVQVLEIQNKVLTEQLTEIRQMLIERHVVKGEGFKS